MTNNTHPIFAALLADVREATQTLTNCAAKGKLQKDGTRMPNKPRSYDPKCHLLAEQFLSDHLPFSEAENDALAWAIQDAIEDWFFARENRTEEQP
jgi:Mn-dependent DtxR family transcriptional regulator